MKKIVFVLGILLALVLMTGFVFAGADEATLIRFSEDKPISEIAKEVGKDESEVEKIDQLNVIRVKDLGLWVSIKLQAKRIFTDKIEFIEKDHEVKAFTNDTYYSSQWNLPKVSAPSAWAITTGSADVDIAIVDTGINGTHEDLTGKALAGYNYVTPGEILANTNSDDNGHGTAIASIAAANTGNAAGIAGVSWYSELIPVKVLNASGLGTASNLALGIRYAADSGAEVINMSLGSDSPSTVVAEAVDYAYGGNHLLVAASGNSGSSISYPARYSNVLAVGASDSGDNRWSSSNYGPELDLVAPGVDVPCANVGGGYYSATGTSAAVPHVSAVAALLKAQKPSIGVATLMNDIAASADKVAGMGGSNFTNYYGYGRLNASRSFSWGSYNAQAAGQTQGVTILPGSSLQVYVKFTNVGSATWYNTGDYPVRLALDKYWATSTAWEGPGWISPNRIVTAQEGNIAPGQTGTFVFNISCPTTMPPGTHHFYVRLLAENLIWFDNPDTNGGAWWTITVPSPQAAAAGQSGGVAAWPGQAVNMWVRFRNQTNYTWHNYGSIPVNLAIDRLADEGFLRGFYHWSWLSSNRVARMAETDVASGQYANFYFPIQIPQGLSPGTYRFNARLVQDGYAWFEPDINGGAWWPVTVPKTQAEHAGQSGYPTLSRGESATLWVKFRNTSGVTWPASGASPVSLALDKYWASSTAWQGSGWISPNRITAAQEGDIYAGYTGTFSFNISVPQTMPSGFHRFYVRLVSDGNAWFDDPDTNGAAWWGINVR